MTKKHTKKALFSSVMALILCFAMLAGTTFAWFTDNVTSGVNQINAGNLDVELLRDGKAITENDKLFLDVTGNEIAYWEPGVVAYTNVKVNNAGTLALKYSMTINVTEINTTDDGKSLCDVLKVAVVKNGVVGTTREAVLTEAENANKFDLQTFHESGKLYPENSTLGQTQSEVYGLVVYWPDDNTNEYDNQFNMNNGKTTSDGKPLHIQLGLNLAATQLAAESDAFGPDYDADAWDDAMVVLTAEDLMAAITQDDKVILQNDIELDAPLAIANNVSINLNDNTLSAAGEVLTVADGVAVSIGNGEIISAAADQNAITVNGTLNLNDVKMNFEDMEEPDYNAIYVSSETGTATLNINDGTELNVSADWATPIFAGKNSVVNVNGGEINVENTLYNAYCVWGIFVDDSSAIINITDGVFNVKGIHSASAVYAESAAPTVNISGGTFNIETSGSIGYGIGVEVYKGTVNATGGTFNIKATGGTAYAFEENSNPGVLDLNVGSGVTINVWERDGNTAYESGNANPDGCSAVIKAVHTVTPDDTMTPDEALVEAIKNAQNGDEIVLESGAYTMPDGSDLSLQGKALTISGTKNTVLDVSNIDERDQYVTGADLTFEGVTLNFGTANYMGFANAANLTYKDCVINGLQFCYGSGEYSFINCDLNSNGAEHCVWTWGGQNVSFTDCDFTYGDRAVNCYGEGVTTNVSFTDCTFTKVAGKETSGAIETNSSALTALNLTINDCSVNEGDLWWVSEWDKVNNVHSGAKTYTTVDGKVIATTAKQLAGVVAKGATNIYLADGEYNVENCGGKTLTINGSENTVIKIVNDGEAGLDGCFDGSTVTFNGVTFDSMENGGSYKGFTRMNGIYNNCTFIGEYCTSNYTHEFNECTFDTKNGYIWMWGADTVTFNDCAFGTNSKAILAHGGASTVININDCQFNATEVGKTGAGDPTAAVEIDPVGTNTYTINFTGDNSKTENYAGWTRIKDGSTGHTINGV